MERLTARQEEFLLFFAGRADAESWISEAADRFKVSKATVSITCSALMKYGMVGKTESGSFALTAEGAAYIGEKLNMARRVTLAFTTHLGLSPCDAEMEARKLVTALRPGTIELLLESWNGAEPSRSEDPEPEQNPLAGLEAGTYLLPFQLRKPDRRELSMGDRGFRKPAQLILDGEESRLILYPARFSYRPLHHKAMAGALERLWFHAGEVWTESCADGDGGYALPLTCLRFRRSEEGFQGVVRIRARSSVGLRKMPESEADLVFSLDELREK